MIPLYPVPTASVFTDWQQYIPLLLSAVDNELDRPGVWDGNEDLALEYMEDLKQWLMRLDTVTLS